MGETEIVGVGFWILSQVRESRDLFSVVVGEGRNRSIGATTLAATPDPTAVLHAL